MWALLNFIAAELLKLKNNRLFLVATILALLIPAGMVWQESGRPDWWLETIGLENWARAEAQTSLLIIGPILSGFVLTHMIQLEYSERTIISMLTAPVPRKALLGSKLIVWLLWNVVIALETWGVLAVGSYILYPDLASAAAVLWIGSLVGKCTLLSVGLLLPVMAVSVWQRKMFYPSLLLVFFLTLLSTLSYQTYPVLPFMAVNTLFSGGAPAVYMLTAKISLTLWAALGLSAAWLSFERQAL